MINCLSHLQAACADIGDVSAAHPSPHAAVQPRSQWNAFARGAAPVPRSLRDWGARVLENRQLLLTLVRHSLGHACWPLQLR